MNDRDTILIVEDEEHLATGLKFNFEAENYVCEVAQSGEAALQSILAERRRYSAMVLDIMLPGKTGFEVSRELRNREVFVPILMLTALGRSEDVLKGFEAGADDYLSKPFDLLILIARVRALIRRKQWAQHLASAPLDQFAFDGRKVDFSRLMLETGQETIPLTVMEAELLRELIANEGKPVSRKLLLEKVWGLKEDTDTRAIDNFIVRLRRYIEDDAGRPKHLLTVRGVGYQFKK